MEAENKNYIDSKNGKQVMVDFSQSSGNQEPVIGTPYNKSSAK